jgi:uncharacterized membrane protein YsdA (DUF1294 family)
VAVLLAAGLDVAVPSLDFLACWLVAISLTAFLAYGYDKAIARSRRTRVPEKVLLVLTLAGGTVGSLAGMFAFRHKTSKRSFQARLAGVVVIQVALIAAYYALLKPLLPH